MKRPRWIFVSCPALLLCLAACAAAQEDERRPLAEVDGVPIHEDDLEDRSNVVELQQRLYQARLEAVEETVAQRLLAKEAERRGMTVEELLAAEVESKVEDPADDEVAELYEQQKSRIRRPLEEIREPLVEAMRRMRADQEREKFVASLREKSDVEILLEPPRVEVDVAGEPRRGPADAPVTMVEFSDFQCPFCRRMQPVLMELFDEYEGKVSWVFKDLPLTQIHSQAQRAAEAARCAGDQGKFWEFRDALFERSRVTEDTPDEIAAELELEEEPFHACLESGKYKAEVLANSREAQQLGISGTPTFVVNGIVLSGLQSKSALTRVIEAELARAERTKTAQAQN